MGSLRCTEAITSLTFGEKLVKLVEEKSVVFGVQKKDPQVLSF